MYFILIDEFGNLLIYAAEFNNNILCVDFLKKNSPPSPEISESAFDKKEKKNIPSKSSKSVYHGHLNIDIYIYMFALLPKTNLLLHC